MLSSNNLNRFENFIELINHAFNARSKSDMISMVYEYLPKILLGDVLFFSPSILYKQIEIELPDNIKLNKSERDVVSKIKLHHENNIDDYPAKIEDWNLDIAKMNSEIIFVLASKDSEENKNNLLQTQKENIIFVLASLMYRLEELEHESKSKIQLEKEKLRAQILSSVSHDLKTPLAAIIGSLNILVSMESKISAEQKKDLLKSSISEAYRLNNFITNILNIARIETGVVKPRMEWYDVGDLVRVIAKDFRLKYPERTIKVMGSTDNLNINCDAILFEQMVFNILDNATKYSIPEKEIELIIEKDKKLNFLIKDSGKGVPDDMLEKIFDKYTRLQMEDRQVAGTGLGLAIAKSLAELQNGEISALNNPEGGMTFKISWTQWK